MNPSEERYFFLGVGGMGMLPLALYLRQGGARVQGMDDGLTPRAEKILREAGVEIHEFVPEALECTVLVVSSAIRPDHPLYRRVAEQPIPPAILRRGELLAKLAETRRFLAVAGSHGKTTTTALLAHLAAKEGWSADFLIGGLPEGDTLPACNGGSEWLIAEVDESDGTIEGFSPEVTLFLNFDWDHADRYPDPAAIRGAWERLAKRTTGSVVAPESSNPDLEPEWTGVPRLLKFDDSGEDFLERNIHAAGAAFAAAVGRDPTRGWETGFGGVWRRQTFHTRGPDFAVIEDYAHHPREVSAFLDWMREQKLPESLRVFFQPHRFSRTTRFVDEFVEALSGLEEVVLHSIYGAGESADPESDPLENIRMGLEEKGVNVRRVERLADFPSFSGTFAFVGAGDANEWAPVVCAVREESSPVKALARLARQAISGGEIREQEPLGPHTTMRVGGPAGLWVMPGSVAEMRWLLRTARLLEVPVEYVGNGSNLLVSDEGFDGVIVHLGDGPWTRKTISSDGKSVLVGAGVTMPGLARWAASNGLEGFSFLEGIPGSVGGGVRMNAGSMGSWIGDRVERIEGIDSSGKQVALSRDQLSFSYRSCPRLEGLCIIRVVLQILGKDSPETIRQTMRDFASRRRASQPGGPSAGCLFRNPEGDSAGRLIDAAGLKGFRVGGVRISEKHANFVQPESGAKASEVLAVMNHTRKAVREQFGVSLQPEVKFLGPRGMEPVFVDAEEDEDERIG